MKHTKLVRDNIIEILRNKDRKPEFHIADDQEYWHKLKEKLTEEVDEFKASENEEELGDILEVVAAIVDYQNWSMSKIEAARQNKKSERGGFTKRIILEKS